VGYGRKEERLRAAWQLPLSGPPPPDACVQTVSEPAPHMAPSRGQMSMLQFLGPGTQAGTAIGGGEASGAPQAAEGGAAGASPSRQQHEQRREQQVAQGGSGQQLDAGREQVVLLSDSEAPSPVRAEPLSDVTVAAAAASNAAQQRAHKAAQGSGGAAGPKAGQTGGTVAAWPCQEGWDQQQQERRQQQQQQQQQQQGWDVAEREAANGRCSGADGRGGFRGPSSGAALLASPGQPAAKRSKAFHVWCASDEEGDF
jgi:hypothetical protein